MIRLINVNKYYHRKKSNEIHVIQNTSIELGDKGLVTFLGPSGCGKTTLLNAIGGLDKVNSGQILIDDQEMTCRSWNKKDELRNACVGYIFQNYNLIEDATVFDNVALVLKMMGIRDKTEIEERVMYILRRVGIDRYKHRPAKMLSGGERQRVGIARALVKNPRIIIADEPTGNLDSSNTIEIMNIIKAISREKLVILVTHEREIAEFYATRIIEIVDGKIVGDQDNEHDNKLDYRLENKIYLRDLPVQKELQQDGVRLRYYSDQEGLDLDLKLVIKNNHVYIELPEGFNDGSKAVDLVDDHYQEISKEIYEEYEFNYDHMVDRSFKPKYTSIFNPLTMMTSGVQKLKNYSLIKKILLAGFVLASMFVIYAFSSVAGITSISDDEFVTVNQNYLTVNVGKVTPAVYEKYEKMEGIDYVLPGDSLVSFPFPLDDYYQSAGCTTELSGSLAGRKLVDKDCLLVGRQSEKKKELVVDKLVLDRMMENKLPQMIGLDTYEEFVGRVVDVNGLGEFTIVGVTNQGSPSIYAAKAMLMQLLRSQNGDGDQAAYGEDDVSLQNDGTIVEYTLVKDSGDVDIVYGSAPEKTYEALVSLDMQYEVAIGSTLDTKVNDRKLTVCGFYTSKSDVTDKIYVTAKTANYQFMSTMQNLMLSPEDKTATFAALSEQDVKVTDNYAHAREEYVKSIRKQVYATVLVALIMLLISLIEMYLMLRSSFLSRIKEVGVLRAIGLKKKDIYKMFLGEIVVLTLLTTLPGMAVMGYIIDGLMEVPYIGDQLLINPTVFGLSFCTVLFFNMVAGLLPVFNTLRKTPAEILARNDVN